MTMLVRADCARGYSELVRQLGGDPDRLFRDAHLNPAAMTDPHAYVSHRGLIHALERAAATLNCADFGLRLAGEQDIGILGPMAVAMTNAPTVGDALHCASKYLYTHAPSMHFGVQPAMTEQRSMLKLDFLLPGLGPHRQAAEAHVGVLHRIMLVLSDGQYRPLAVSFRHRPVSASYTKFFGAPVRFEASEDGILVSNDVLLAPIKGHDRQLQEIAAGYLDAQFPVPTGRLTAQVRLLAERLLSADRCVQTEAATALGMQVRTFQRRLQEEGTSFEELRDEARRDLALRYFAQPDIPLSQVSALLGYAEPSALSRSCRRWFGRSPREMRTAQRELAAA